MGFDAYRLVGVLFSDELGAWPIRGLSGDLSLDTQGRVHRVLPLAQFREGRPAPFEPALPPQIHEGVLIGRR
jgi:outer membrane PBP1 activator LpoA protein